MKTNAEKTQWHLSKSIPITVLTAFIGQTFMFGWWASRLESSISQNEKKINEHIINKSEHMPFSEKITVFVPRVELDGRLKSIEKTQVEMSKDIKELLRKRVD